MVTAWVAIDDSDEENAALQIIPRSHLNAQVPFDTSLPDENNVLNQTVKEPAKWGDEPHTLELKAGEMSLHSDWLLHGSDPNHSERRRLAWIVRYCPTGTAVQPGLRGSFGADYKFIPVAGRGAVAEVPEPGRERYAPCFGNSDALKK